MKKLLFLIFIPLFVCAKPFGYSGKTYNMQEHNKQLIESGEARVCDGVILPFDEIADKHYSKMPECLQKSRYVSDDGAICIPPEYVLESFNCDSGGMEVYIIYRNSFLNDY